MDHDERLKRLTDAVERELIPHLRDSAVVASLVPRGPTDVKYAVELGLSIMMDKPIIALVRPGVRIPEKLAKVVDRFIEIGSLDEPGLARRIAETVAELKT